MDEMRTFRTLVPGFLFYVALVLTIGILRDDFTAGLGQQNEGLGTVLSVGSGIVVAGFLLTGTWIGLIELALRLGLRFGPLSKLTYYHETELFKDAVTEISGKKADTMGPLDTTNTATLIWFSIAPESLRGYTSRRWSAYLGTRAGILSLVLGCIAGYLWLSGKGECPCAGQLWATWDCRDSVAVVGGLLAVAVFWWVGHAAWKDVMIAHLDFFLGPGVSAQDKWAKRKKSGKACEKQRKQLIEELRKTYWAGLSKKLRKELGQEKVPQQKADPADSPGA